MKPSGILAKLCKERRIDPPVYEGKTVQFMGKTFFADDMVETIDGKNGTGRTRKLFLLLLLLSTPTDH